MPAEGLEQRFQRLTLRPLPPGPVGLLAGMSKGQPPSGSAVWVGCGQRSFGESAWQERGTKQLELADLEPATTGISSVRLQANKGQGELLRISSTIIPFGQAPPWRALQAHRQRGRASAPGCFLQVKLRPDPGKTGFEAAELERPLA